MWFRTPAAAARCAGHAPAWGKRGGARVIYLTHQPDGSLVLLLIYGKAARETIAASVLREIAKELGHGDD